MSKFIHIKAPQRNAININHIIRIIEVDSESCVIYLSDGDTITAGYSYKEIIDAINFISRTGQG